MMSKLIKHLSQKSIIIKSTFGIPLATYAGLGICMPYLNTMF